MKKLARVVILLLCLLLAWNIFVEPFNANLHFDDGHLDGPLGALLGLLFAGGGLIVAALVVLFVGAMLAVLFAGLGLLLTLGLGVGTLVVAAAISPLLLPLLIPVAIIWFFMHRSRRNRLKAEAA